MSKDDPNYKNASRLGLISLDVLFTVEPSTRKDDLMINRVELSCYTNMSPKVGIATAEEYLNRAKELGMEAIAITDKANIQAFTDAVKTINRSANPPKVIYGINAAFDKHFCHYDIDECQPFSWSSVAPNVLVKNQNGLTDLYRLLTDEYCGVTGFLDKLIGCENSNCREGLLIGSGGWDYKVQQSIEKEGKSIEDLTEKAAFYDYLEIHPRYNGISEIEHQNRVSYMIRLGELAGRPVVATGNAGYINPEDKLCLDSLCSLLGTGENLCNEKRHLITTEEMLNEFSFLSEEKALEVVVTNSRRIADMIEYIDPISDENDTLSIENAFEILEQACTKKLNEIYTAGVPSEATMRLADELKHIRENGYATDYFVGMNLVSRSIENGFPVVMRGCAGGSFVAFLSGITNINPFPPHYYCPNCGTYEFVGDINTVSDDLSEKCCGKCGYMMERLGYNLPVETFTGLEGDKEPDFDYNFSGEYQPKAIEHLKALFGKEKVIRAGTIGRSWGLATLAVDEYAGKISEDEKERVIDKLSVVKCSNSIHPGGVLIVPKDVDVIRYTPLQTLAHVTEKVTHFDYHALEHCFKRFDCLGHRSPTYLYILKKLTGKELKLDDQNRKVILNFFRSIYEGTEKNASFNFGTIGIPEFGNKDIVELIKEIKPNTIGDLIRIDAVYHSTDAWTNNAEELIEKGVANFDEIICSRDDVFLYLMSKGISREDAYEIMDIVRRGRIASGKFTRWDEYKIVMREHGVPEWYIDSCSKMKYLFPKAHCAGYVLTSLIITLYKIYYPDEFYAAYAVLESEKLEEYIIGSEGDVTTLGASETDEEAEILTEIRSRDIAIETVRRNITKIHEILDGNINK